MIKIKLETLELKPYEHQTEVVCPRCDGSGDYDCHHYGHEEECNNCDGIGTVRWSHMIDEIEIPIGEMNALETQLDKYDFDILRCPCVCQLENIDLGRSAMRRRKNRGITDDVSVDEHVHCICQGIRFIPRDLAERILTAYKSLDFIYS